MFLATIVRSFFAYIFCAILGDRPSDRQERSTSVAATTPSRVKSRIADFFRSIYRKFRPIPEPRIVRVRRELDETVNQLAKAEKLIRDFSTIKSLEALLTYINALGCKNKRELEDELWLTDGHVLKLPDRLRYRVSTHRWETTDPEETWLTFWPEAIESQNMHWREYAAGYRRDINNLRSIIDELERKSKTTEPTAAQTAIRVASPDIDDDHAQLRKIRAQIADLRSQEQKLEEKILDKQGAATTPLRRSAGVSTD